MRRIRFLVIILLLSLFKLSAEELTEPFSWIGLTPAEALQRFGPPESVYSLRGGAPAEDSVVFYRRGLYLYFFQDRLWQLRVDRSSGLSIYSIEIGMERERVREKLGAPLYADRGGDYWELHRDIFPIRLRLLFDSANRVEDIYLYRGDF